MFQLILRLALFAFCCAVLALLAVIFFPDTVLPPVLEQKVQACSGFGVSIGSSDSSIAAGEFRYTGVTVTNPAEFPAADFVVARELHLVGARPGTLYSLMRGEEAPLEELSLHLAKVCLVRDSSGHLNAVSFAHNIAQHGDPFKRDGQSVLVHKLTVRLDAARIMDFSGERPQIREIPVNYEKEFRDVKAFAEVVRQLAQDFAKPEFMELGSAMLQAAGTFPTLQKEARALSGKHGYAMAAPKNPPAPEKQEKPKPAPKKPGK